MTVLERATAPAVRPATLTTEASALDPIALFAAAREVGLEAALWLQPAAGFALVGIGRAWSVEPSGPGRFDEVSTAWRGLLAAGLGEHADDVTRGGGPVLLGGLGFSGAVPADDAAWAPFGAASLVLPTFAYALTPDGPRLTITSDPCRAGSDDRVVLDRRWAALDRRARMLGRKPDDRPEAGDGPWIGDDGGVSEVRVRGETFERGVGLEVLGSRPDRAAWDRLVGLFAGAVGRGRLDKVVLARRVDLRSGRLFDVPTALRRLARTAPESTVYAFARGGATFLGATPERLVRTERRAFETVAIAGTAPRSADPAEDARLGAGLLASEKDREEHAVVVGMLRASLAPIVEELRVGAEPALLRLRHVQHLVTPVAGTLRDEAGLLGLAGLLHPTPAVGGEPRALALELIAEHEGFDRGWYAGPVGWVGADGDGELAVALRCALVKGPTASLFAGCGIVADSDPEREWDESRTKLHAVASALGVAEETVR